MHALFLLILFNFKVLGFFNDKYHIQIFKNIYRHILHITFLLSYLVELQAHTKVER